MFINLAVHSYYSLLMSSMSIDDIINLAIKNQQKYVALTDFNNLYGAMEFYDKAVKAKLIPIIGLHIKYQQQDVYVIAQNIIGYYSLVKISSLIMTEQAFDINDYLKDIFILVPDIKKSPWLKSSTNVYSYTSDSQPIALNICYYAQPEDVKYVKGLNAIANESVLSDLEKNHQWDNYHLISQVQAQTKFTAQALANLEHVINHCQWQMTFYNKIHFVKFDSKVSSQMLLQTKCKEGLKLRLNSANAPDTYIERLKKELAIIDQMHFNDYFLVVQDYVSFARKHGILVGPGRGSAAGSLTAYVLGITDIDPIANNLIFERFLNPQRITMPDIDIDFMDTRRNEVIEYLFNRYQKNHVAHIITFQRMRAKMAIRDVGRILGLHIDIVNKIAKLFTLEYDLDIQAAVNQNPQIKTYAQQYPSLFDLASKFVNLPRQIGVHAAGVIITDQPLDQIIPIQNSTDGIFATQYSMEYLERLGLIKMDILGLVNLTVIAQTLELIKIHHGININLETINLTDQKVFQRLAAGDTIGIFQLESPGMTQLITRIKPISIEDISITSALFRPGPQKNIATYLTNKANPDKINYLNKDFEQVLSFTYNIIIYQEQVIEMVQRVANFSLAEADNFRRAISKKDAKQLTDLSEKFIKAAVNNHYSLENAQKIYDYIFEFANYGFNHSHSLAYSYVSYWMAYLKTYYPREYFCVLLSASENSPDKLAQYSQAARTHNIEVLPPDLNKSNISFTIDKKGIIFGFVAIKGLGYETANKLITIRNNCSNKEFVDYIDAINKLASGGIGIKTLEILIKAGSFDNLLNKQTVTFLLHNLPQIYETSKTMLATGETLIKPKLKSISQTKEDQSQLLRTQFELLGVNFVAHPMIKIKKEYGGSEQIVDLTMALNSDRVNHVLAILLKYREIKTKTGQAMAFAKIEDNTFVSDVVIFPGVYAKVKTILKNDSLYVVTVKTNERGLQALGFKEYHE
ncbi:MAG: DNA polymerase III subunit alpha [Mycoplasmataceae bacterium]|nr:DNA polymerase III subunit alpha [Mycoplasmataceae bacterium]